MSGKTPDPSTPWLVRTSLNTILGPFPAETVRQMVVDGRLSAHDEVCAANSFWFYLHEAEELQTQLDVALPRTSSLGPDEEDTQTDTKVLTPKATPSQVVLDLSAQEPPIPELPDVSDLSSASEGLDGRNKAQTANAPKFVTLYTPQIFGNIERRSAWSVIAIALGILIIVLLMAVIQLTRQ